jgi:hypothetical protein
MKRIVAASLAAFSSYGWSQQLVAVAPPNDNTGIVIVALIALSVGGLLYLKRKRPELLAKIEARVQALIKRKPSAPSVPAAAVDHFVSQPADPAMYAWLVAENERLRRVIEQLQAQQSATIPIPYDQPGFLKA